MAGISINTFGDMLADNYQLRVYCDDCGRNAVLDLATLPPDRGGIGERYKCQVCGGRGRPIMTPIHTGPSRDQER